MKIERYEDTEEYREKVRKLADQIIDRIMVQAYYLEKCTPYRGELVVFISKDLLAALACVSADYLQQLPYPKVGKICGYDVKPICGTDELYMGIKI